jgi:hypothetical protein
MAPLALTPAALHAQDQKSRTYHDKDHNDDHEWNAHENQVNLNSFIRGVE